MTVKADSKGRLTGAQPGKTYLKEVDGDGTVRYVPQAPKNYDRVKDVTLSDFEEFFGVSMKQASASDFGVVSVYTTEKGIAPYGISLKVFETDECGDRVRDPASGTPVTTQLLIRLKTDE